VDAGILRRPQHVVTEGPQAMEPSADLGEDDRLDLAVRDHDLIHE
jgi:hypothetical protein